MRTVIAVMFAAACGSATPAAPRAPEAPAQTAAHTGLRIKLANVYVDDQDKALHFYTDVLGFAKKDDVTNGPYRWLTVTDRSGSELLLANDSDPAAKAYQQALFEQNQPAVMFFTNDIKAEYERIKTKGAEFTLPPTEVMPGSTITTFKDTCGNLIQITQLTAEAHP